MFGGLFKKKQKIHLKKYDDMQFARAIAENGPKRCLEDKNYYITWLHLLPWLGDLSPNNLFVAAALKPRAKELRSKEQWEKKGVSVVGNAKEIPQFVIYDKRYDGHKMEGPLMTLDYYFDISDTTSEPVNFETSYKKFLLGLVGVNPFRLVKSGSYGFDLKNRTINLEMIMDYQTPVYLLYLTIEGLLSVKFNMEPSEKRNFIVRSCVHAFVGKWSFDLAEFANILWPEELSEIDPVVFKEQYLDLIRELVWVLSNSLNKYYELPDYKKLEDEIRGRESRLETR